jgi:DNA-directed RNA polymerase omega subunit
MNVKKLENWLNSVDSRHRAVLVVSKRAKQIQKGLRPYFDSKSSKVTTMALEEFVEGKIDWYELTEEEIEARRVAYERAQKAEEMPGVQKARSDVRSELKPSMGSVEPTTEKVPETNPETNPETEADAEEDSLNE